MKAKLVRCPEKNKMLREWINEKNSKGSTPLHLAAIKGNIEIISLLIENGVDVNCLNNINQNVLHSAAQGRCAVSLIYFYLKFNMDLNYKDSNCSTPLHLACFYGAESCVNFLISWKCELNDQDLEGYTPLHLAVHSGTFLNKNLYRKYIRR